MAGAVFCYNVLMANSVYKSGYINLDDGELYITPLKIKYLRVFLDLFDDIKGSESDDMTIDILVKCGTVCMRQFRPEIATTDQLEDLIDLDNLYLLLEYAAGIKIKEDTNQSVTSQAKESGSTWDELDLAKLESEAFLLGIWKDYEDLESSMSMPELVATLNAKKESEYQERKFLAAIQGIDLDKQSGKNDAWEEMKARVFSKGKTSDPNDILAYQGVTAQKAGFGIGMGLNYENLTEKN